MDIVSMRDQEVSGDALVPLLPPPPSGVLLGRSGRCLVLSMRHLGDAVIGSGFINSLQRHNPSMSIDVLGRPGLEEVIRSFSSIGEYINVDFPVFQHHRRNMTACMKTIRSMRMVKKRKYDFCINLIGDVRENAIGFLIGANWNIAPIWARGHLFKRKMTDAGASKISNCGIVIPTKYPNFYQSMHYFANQLGLPGLEWKNDPDRRKKNINDKIVVALHPGASHPSRHWPEARWRILIEQINSMGHSIVILGAPSERSSLLSTFRKEIDGRAVELITEGIAGLVSRLSATDVLIGMDSFSVHAAYALEVSVVVLNGSADPSILTPPEGIVTSAGHLCAKYPCYYDYPCQRKVNEYICVRGIEVDDVISALNVILERRDI